MKLLKRRIMDALALVLVALMGLSTFGVVSAVSVDAEAAGPFSVGTPEAYGAQTANPEFGDGCGTDVVLLLDERDDIAQAESDALRLAVDAFAGALAGSDSRLAVIPFADRAEMASVGFESPNVESDVTSSTTLSPENSAPQANVTAEASAPTTTIPRASGGSNWESALNASAGLAGKAREGAKTVTVLLTAGPPNRHLIGAADESLATSAPLGIHMLEAVTAANRLKNSSRVIAVGVGGASNFRAELAAVSGHDWSDTTTAAVDKGSDVLLVPDAANAPTVLAELAERFCSVSATLRLVTSDPDGSGDSDVAVGQMAVAVDPEPVPAPIAPGIAAETSGGPNLIESTVAEPAPKNPPAEELVTDEAGIAATNLRVSGPTDLVLSPGVATDHVSGSCISNGEAIDVELNDGQVVVPGVTNGDDISCQLRVLNPDEPLVVTHHSAPGNVRCDATTPIDDSSVLSAVGGQVTHCIEVINAGGEPLQNVEIDSDVTDADDWADTTTLAPGESVLRRVVATLDEAGDVLTRAKASTVEEAEVGLEASDRAELDTLPPALAVARGLLTTEGDCDLDAPLSTAIGAVVPLCYEVTNTGGTSLVDITVVDEATESPMATRGTALPLAPSESMVLRTTTRLIADAAAATVSARPADLDGDPIEGTPSVSANSDADEPLMRVDHRTSDDDVASGESVDFSVTVSNPGPVPLENVEVDESVCTDGIGSPDKLVSDADDLLDPGEAWVYQCSEPIGEDVVAMAAASATALGEPLLSTAAARVSARRVDMTINKKSDQRLRFGDVIQYRIESYSFGPDTVDNAKIIDELPAGLVFVDATSGRGSCSNSGRTVTCDIGRFEPLERIQVRIFTRIADASWVGKVIINEARVTASSATDRVDNTDSHIDRVQAASVTTTTRRPTTLKPEDQTEVTAPIPQQFATTTARGATTTTQRPSTTTTERNNPGAGAPTTARVTTTTARATTTTARVTTPTAGGQTPTTATASGAATSTTAGGVTSSTTSGLNATATTRTVNEVQRPVTTAQSVDVTFAAARTEVAATTRMANTGVDSDALVANALVFLAAGMAFVGLARRRRLLF